MSNNNNDGEVIKTRRSRIQEVHVYDVYEHEIEAIERGENTPLLLTFGLAILSLGLGAIFSLATANFTSSVAEQMMYAFATSGNLLAVILLLFWWKGRKENKTICTKIKERATTYITQSVPVNAENSHQIDDKLPD